MSDLVHISDIATLDPNTWPDIKVATRANVHRYINQFGQTNESYDYVDEDGVVVGSGISTNVGQIK